MATLDKDDAKIIADAFVSAITEVKKGLPNALQQHAYEPQMANGVQAKFQYVIPPDRSEFISKPNPDVKGAHITRFFLTTPTPEPIGLSGLSLKDDGSIFFKFSKTVPYPLTYIIFFVK